jgi:hypothetical protein
MMGTASKWFEEKKWDGAIKILSTVEDGKSLVVTYDTTIPDHPVVNRDMLRKLGAKTFRRHEGNLKYSGLQVLFVERIFKVYLKPLETLLPY